MLVSILDLLPVVSLIAFSPAQIQGQAHTAHVTIQLVVAREPRPEAPDETNTNTTKSNEENTRPAPQTPFVSRSFTGRILLRPPGSALITLNDENRIERQRLTINTQTAVLWQAANKPGQPSLYKELTYIPREGSPTTGASAAKDRLTALLAKTALLDPISAYILAGDNPRPALERQGVTNWTTLLILLRE